MISMEMGMGFRMLFVNSLLKTLSILIPLLPMDILARWTKQVTMTKSKSFLLWEWEPLMSF